MNTRHLWAATVLLGTMASVPAMAASNQAALPEGCGKQWTVVDTDNDGMVTAQEAEAARDLEFVRLDQDKDDRISREEWSKCNDLAMSGQINADAGSAQTGDQQGTTAMQSGSTQGATQDSSGQSASNTPQTGSSAQTGSGAQQSASATPQTGATGESGSGTQTGAQQGAAADMQQDSQGQSGTDQQRLSAYGEQLPPFEQLDKDSDGFASSMEVADAFKEAYGSGDVQAASLEDQARRMSSWYFSNDKNADQKLEQTEWTENINRPDAAAGAHFDMADTNKDGAIDRSEWNTRHEQRWQSAQQDASADGVTIWRFYMLR